MNKIVSGLFGVLLLLLHGAVVAQSGADPAVTSRNLEPAPVAGLGSPFSLSFTIGNNGPVPISGVGTANQMQWSICLARCAPNTADPIAALSGPLLTYFDVTFSPPTSTTSQGGCYQGKQKAGVAIGAVSVYRVVISAVVTKASASTAINEIGAACNITPDASSGKQPIDNDFASIYTHTTTLALPVSLVEFTAQSQEDRTVLVNWTTSWEQNNAGYLIERSKDLKHFETVGSVNEVAGSSTSLNTYRFVDTRPYRGTSYYRLRQLDANGRGQVFDAKSVVIDGRYGVYPNPVVGQGFTLALDEPASAVLRFYNASGDEVAISRSDLSEQSMSLTPGTTLTSGVYILTVEERGITRKHRLVIQ